MSKTVSPKLSIIIHLWIRPSDVKKRVIRRKWGKFTISLTNYILQWVIPHWRLLYWGVHTCNWSQARNWVQSTCSTLPWLFHVCLSEPGEKGLVARLCGLQIVLVGKKNYSIVKQRDWEWNWRQLACAGLHTVAVIPVVAPGWESCYLGVRMEMYSIAH